MKIFFIVLFLAMFSVTAFAHGHGYGGDHGSHQSPWNSFLYGLGQNLGRPYSPYPVYPPYGYGYSSPGYYYSPRPYCNSVDVGGYYDYYGRYIPDIRVQCEYR